MKTVGWMLTDRQQSNLNGQIVTAPALEPRKSSNAICLTLRNWCRYQMVLGLEEKGVRPRTMLPGIGITRHNMPFTTRRAYTSLVIQIRYWSFNKASIRTCHVGLSLSCPASYGNLNQDTRLLVRNGVVPERLCISHQSRCRRPDSVSWKVMCSDSIKMAEVI